MLQGWKEKGFPPHILADPGAPSKMLTRPDREIQHFPSKQLLKHVYR
jgi:hypothetical protein